MDVVGSPSTNADSNKSVIDMMAKACGILIVHMVSNYPYPSMFVLQLLHSLWLHMSKYARVPQTYLKLLDW